MKQQGRSCPLWVTSGELKWVTSTKEQNHLYQKRKRPSKSTVIDIVYFTSTTIQLAIFISISEGYMTCSNHFLGEKSFCCLC